MGPARSGGIVSSAAAAVYPALAALCRTRRANSRAGADTGFIDEGHKLPRNLQPEPAMNLESHSLKSTLLTAAAALLCTGLQFSGIDALSTPRHVDAQAQVLQLPLVFIGAHREAAPVEVQKLPQVVIVGQRSTATTVAAQGGKARSTS
jgi:hypothetical protein